MTVSFSELSESILSRFFRFIMDVLTLNGYQSSDVKVAIDSVMGSGYLDDVIDAFTSNLEKISSRCAIYIL